MHSGIRLCLAAGLATLSVVLLSETELPSAQAFVTIGWGGVNVHGQITREGARGVVLSPAALNRIVSSNKRQDTDSYSYTLKPNSYYNPAHHFDRNRGDLDAGAFRRGAFYVQSQTSAAIQAIRQQHPEDALDALGRASHALQDFFAHSNFVDLSSSEQVQISAALDNPSAAIPNSLRITGYDQQNGGDISGDTYGHDEFNKDGRDISGRESSESRAPLNGTTKHAVAVRFATDATARLFQRIKNEAGPNWVILADYAGK